MGVGCTLPYATQSRTRSYSRIGKKPAWTVMERVRCAQGMGPPRARRGPSGLSAGRAPHPAYNLGKLHRQRPPSGSCMRRGVWQRTPILKWRSFSTAPRSRAGISLAGFARCHRDRAGRAQVQALWRVVEPHFFQSQHNLKGPRHTVTVQGRFVTDPHHKAPDRRRLAPDRREAEAPQPAPPWRRQYRAAHHSQAAASTECLERERQRDSHAPDATTAPPRPRWFPTAGSTAAVAMAAGPAGGASWTRPIGRGSRSLPVPQRHCSPPLRHHGRECDRSLSGGGQGRAAAREMRQRLPPRRTPQLIPGRGSDSSESTLPSWNKPELEAQRVTARVTTRRASPSHGPRRDWIRLAPSSPSVSLRRGRVGDCDRARRRQKTPPGSGHTGPSFKFGTGDARMKL